MIVLPARTPGVRAIMPLEAVEPLLAPSSAPASDAPVDENDLHRELIPANDPHAFMTGEERPDESFPVTFPVGIRAYIFPELSAADATPEGEAALTGKQSYLKKRVTVTHSADGLMWMNVWIGNRYEESSIVLTLTDSDTPVDGPRITAAWREWIDSGPWNSSHARAFTGDVRVNTADWRTTRPPILEWDIYGLFGGDDPSIECHHDKVIIR